MAKIGDLYWLTTKSDIAHPHVVVNADQSTLIVCPITSNMHRLSFPGNVHLQVGEGNLQKPSVIESSKYSEVQVESLADYIGSIDLKRVQQVLNSIAFVNRIASRQSKTAGV